MISALILEEIMWKNRLLCKNKIVTIFLLVFYTSKRYLFKKHTSYINFSFVSWLILHVKCYIWHELRLYSHLSLSPPVSPMKNNAQLVSSPAKRKTGPVGSPLRNIQVEQAVLSGSKSQRNPFYKEQLNGNLESSQNILGLHDNMEEKLSKLSETENDEPVLQIK